MRRIFSIISTIFLVLFLASCESSEERAEKYYQNALALMAEGDNDRAIIELRNVFTLNGSHLEARHAIAKLMLEHKNNRQGAYSQYLRLVEQYPDDLIARIALSRLAFQTGNWDELERHAAKAEELATEDPQVQIISLIRSYRAAVLAEDETARTTVAQNATQMVEAFPEDLLLREVLIDNFLRNREFSNALAQLEIATEQDPTQERFWAQRLQVLIQLDDQEAVEAQLVDLVARFPEDAERKSTLVRYYLSRDRLDDTEDFLRQLVAESDLSDPTARVDLIRFMTELRGIDAAMLEIDTAIDVVENPVPFIVLKAGLDFSTGKQDMAITAIENVLESIEPGEESNQTKVTLSRMLLATGNEIGARSLIETVLADDATQVDAIKINAEWLIEADDPDTAIAGLRTALDQNPDDAETLTLMALAYSRTGSTDLARDFLSLAVEASGNAPEETIRYVRLLISEERFLPAEDVLLAAIRLEPQNIELLRIAGELYLSMDDLGRTEQVVQTLRRIGTPQSREVAVGIEAERLNRESGTEQALDYLADVASATDASVSSRVMLIRAQLATGDIASAVELAEELLAENQTNAGVKLVVAATSSSAGDFDRAAEIYRDVLEEFPDQAGVWIQLARIKSRQGDPEGGRTVIAEALELNPENADLLWATASYLEGDGDFEAAIEIYEQLYVQDTSSMVVANNLASLLATYRGDPESLDRAWNIARRFKDAEIPAVQDTYGWITHSRGDSAEALPYLKSAARGLPSDALTQFHLAEALNTLGRKEEALDQYRIVLDLAGATDTRPQIAIARERVSELEQASQSE